MRTYGRPDLAWRLSVDSLKLLAKRPGLLVYPAAGVSAIAALFVALFGLPAGAIREEGIPGVFASGGTLPGSDVLVAVSVALFYVAAIALVVLSAAALMAAVHRVFRGEPHAPGDGLRTVARNLGTLLLWAGAVATVGVVSRVYRPPWWRRYVPGWDPVGLHDLVGYTWVVLSYFTVPVMLFEDTDLRETIDRSGETYGRTWGASGQSRFGIVLVTLTVVATVTIVATLATVVIPMEFSAGQQFLAVMAGSFVGFLVSASLAGVAKVALYVYATEGEPPEAFEGVALGGSPVAEDRGATGA